MKKLLLLFLLFSISELKAQIVLDTISSRYVGPGVLYTDILAPSVPWTIKVLRIDLKNKFLSLEAVKSKDTYYGYEKTSSMSKRRNSAGHTVIGAVNADYYNTANGSLTNIQIGKGEIYRGPVTKSCSIGFDEHNKPILGTYKLDAKVFSGSTSLKINEVNQARAANQMILYNYYKGANTGTDVSGNEALVNPVTAWAANDTVKCVVESVKMGAGNTAIPFGKAVLSGNGTAATYIANNLHAGDTIKLYMGLNPGIPKIKEMVSGHPTLVRNGVNYLETALKTESGSSTTTRAPRSVAGFSQDSTYLYLITLDGRQVSSDGATLAELADLIIRLGVYTGFNLDGGGSTTMVVRNVVKNSPSDGVERSVANSLLVVSSAPNRPDSVSRIGFEYFYKDYLIYNGDRLQLSVYGNDLYDNPVTLDTSFLSYSVTPGLGTITRNGLFIASRIGKSGFLYVRYKDLIDSAFINIIPLNRIALTPKNSMIDAKTPVTLTVRGYAGNNVERVINGKDVAWKSSDTSIAAVDANGVIKGKAEGKVKITAVFYENIADSIDLTVQIGKGTVLTDQMDSPGKWTLSGTIIDLGGTKLSISNDSKSDGNGSFKIEYKYIYNPTLTSQVYLNNTMQFYGLPDSLMLDARSDSSAHKIFLIVTNDLNKSFRVTTNEDIAAGDKFSTIPFSFKDNVPLNNGIFSFPLKLSRIIIQLDYNTPDRVAGNTYSGTIYLDNMKVKYPTSAATAAEEEAAMPKEYSLKQNYPNPFNPSTVIEFTTIGLENSTLKIYDLLGRQVSVLIDGRISAGNHKTVWNAEGMSSGVYFYRLQSGNYTQTRKMLLVR